MTNNTKQTALVTGGSMGIGFELAKQFATNGYDVILVSRTEKDLKSAADKLSAHGTQVSYIAKDLFEPGAAEELYEEVRSKGITINVLVNDAGQGQGGPFLDSELQRDLDIIQLNVTSLTILTKLFLKDMVARNEGKVLQLASVVSKLPSPLLAVYAATKAYVYSLTQSLINELKDTDVTMTALMPGATDTDFFSKAESDDTKTYVDGDLADPADVAKDGYDALMSGESKVVSGFKNRAQLAMSNVTPDQMLAEQMRKQNEPSDKGK